MRWLVLLAMVVVAATVGVARAQLPPLPLPTSTTTSTTEAPPETTIPPDEPPEEPAPTETTFTVPPSEPPVVPGPTVVTPLPTTTITTLARRTAGVPTAPVADAISGGYAIGVATVLVVALVLVFLSSRARPGGFRMNDPRRRWRLLAAVASLAIAALIGVVGWLKLSLEPQVNRQIPYLASAGMGLVVFAAIGGSLLVAEQLRADDERIAELEDAVRRLTATLEPIVESPPRGRTRSS